MRHLALVATAALLAAAPVRSSAVGPWQYAVTGPGGASEIGPDQIGQVLYFELDATVPDYVWGNVRVDFDPGLLECVSIEENPATSGFWTAWVSQATDPALGGGGVPYLYDDTGLGSDWAKAWVAQYGAGNGPVGSYDNAAGIIRFYAMTDAGGLNGAAPLRIGFRIRRAGTAVFTVSANDWTSFAWPAAATGALAVQAAAGQGYSWRLEDLPYQLVSQVTILPAVRTVGIEVEAEDDGACLGRVIEVAIFGAPDLDVTDVDVASVLLEGMPVKTVGKRARLLAEYEDENEDGRLDLVVRIANTGQVSGPGPLRLTGSLRDGTRFEGIDPGCAAAPAVDQ